MKPASFLFRYKQEAFLPPVGVLPVFCIFTRSLLQGLATNRFLFGLELDLSSCEVSIHSHSQTHAHSHVTVYNGDENDADDDEETTGDAGCWVGTQVHQPSSHSESCHGDCCACPLCM